MEPQIDDLVAFIEALISPGFESQATATKLESAPRPALASAQGEQP